MPWGRRRPGPHRPADGSRRPAADRVLLRAALPHRGLIAAYGGIDIALDPFPYTGGLTVCEALWMGVPVVALAGDSFCARHALSHFSNVGLADWVAQDPAGYVALAVARARDLAGLARLRKGCGRGRGLAAGRCGALRPGLAAALRQAWDMAAADLEFGAPGGLGRGNVLLGMGEAWPIWSEPAASLGCSGLLTMAAARRRRTRSAHDPSRNPRRPAPPPSMPHPWPDAMPPSATAPNASPHRCRPRTRRSSRCRTPARPNGTAPI